MERAVENSSMNIGENEAMAGKPAERYAEAPLPTGFAEPNMVRKVQLIDVPAHRAVEGPSFRACFRHIQANDIPMTAPVYMDVETADNGAPRAFGKMRFLYPEKDVDPNVIAKDVEIIDVPQHQAITIHFMGAMTNERCMHAQEQLMKWLDEQDTSFVVDGDPVVLGYNSPFVFPWKKMWAMQIPVKRRE